MATSRPQNFKFRQRLSHNLSVSFIEINGKFVSLGQGLQFSDKKPQFTKSIKENFPLNASRQNFEYHYNTLKLIEKSSYSRAGEDLKRRPGLVSRVLNCSRETIAKESFCRGEEFYSSIRCIPVN